jgi:hypothetical protein
MTMGFKNYTVLLLRPDYIANSGDVPYGQDVYVALVRAESAKDAIARGQAEVFEADTHDALEPNEPEDYAVVVVFDGFHTPELWGWQL